MDVGCGCGATAIVAATIVGPDGPVAGIDVSEPMLGVAEQWVADASLTDVTFRGADAQTHRFEPQAHDVAISRFGTVGFDDAGAAFTTRRVSTPCERPWSTMPRRGVRLDGAILVTTATNR